MFSNSMGKIIEYEGEDRISELPESMLEHILSFMSFKEVVQTSVLSKRWQQLWRFCPVVEFDMSSLPLLSTPDVATCIEQENLQRRRKLLVDLERILKKRVNDKTSMKRFTVRMNSLDSESESFVHRCVSYAIQSNIKELKLDIHCFHKFSLPPVVLSAESMQVLKLSDCKFDSPTSNVKLPSLIKLHLHHVSADSEWVYHLIAKCPLIKDLQFHSCDCKSIKISSPSLESLVIDGCTVLVEVKTETLKLSTFSYYGHPIPIHLNSSALTKCTLGFWSYFDNGLKMKEKCFELLPSFRKIPDLKFLCPFEMAIVPRDLRRALPSPLYGVKHLDFSICYFHEQYFSVLEVLEGLLWISPHAETISITFDSFVRSFKFSYEMQLTYGGQSQMSCCKSRPLLCWRNCMKEVMLEIGNVQEHDESVFICRRYSFRGEEIWEELYNLPDLDFPRYYT